MASRPGWSAKRVAWAEGDVKSADDEVLKTFDDNSAFSERVGSQGREIELSTSGHTESDSLPGLTEERETVGGRRQGEPIDGESEEFKKRQLQEREKRVMEFRRSRDKELERIEKEYEQQFQENQTLYKDYKNLNEWQLEEHDKRLEAFRRSRDDELERAIKEYEQQFEANRALYKEQEDGHLHGLKDRADGRTPRREGHEDRLQENQRRQYPMATFDQNPQRTHVPERYTRPGSLLDVTSSTGMSRDEYQSQTTGRMYSTRPTTVSDSTSSKPNPNKGMMTLNSTTKEPDPPIHRPAAFSMRVNDVGDEPSTISDDSILLNPTYTDIVIKEFATALLAVLPHNHLLPNSRFLENPAFRQSFNGFMKDYAKKVMEGTARRSRRRQASKAIRRLRESILLKLQEAVNDPSTLETPGKISTTLSRKVKDAGLEEQTWKEKCTEWKVDCDDGDMNPNKVQLPMFDDAESACFDTNLDHRNLSDGVSNIVSVSSSGLDDDEESVLRNPKIPSKLSEPDDQDVYSYLTQHEAFSALTSNIQKAMEQHFGNMMELIRHRVVSALRRPGRIKMVAGERLLAKFQTEWDVVAFLEDQFPTGRLQTLRKTLTLTGEAVNAQLSTVERHLAQFWPKYPYLLLDAMSAEIGQIDRKYSRKLDGVF